jgi:hypothetical protein
MTKVNRTTSSSLAWDHKAFFKLDDTAFSVCHLIIWWLLHKNIFIEFSI